MGIPLLAGRDFNERDERIAPAPEGTPDFRVAIVNERFARHYFGGRECDRPADWLRRQPEYANARWKSSASSRDCKYTDVRDDIQRQVFFPYLEISQPSCFTVYLRTQPAGRVDVHVVRQTDRARSITNLPVYGTRTLERQVALSLSRERLVSTMTATFGTLATLLAVVGLYGVMSYTVSTAHARDWRACRVRRHADDIRWLVIREVLVIAAAGIAVALPAAWWLARYVSTQLYGVTAGDPLTIGGAIVLLLLVALAAGLVPSTRAARLNPNIALRTE